MEKGREKKNRKKGRKKKAFLSMRNSGSFLKKIVFWPLRQKTKT